MPLKGADAAQTSRLGVFFTIGAAGQANAALVGLGGVVPPTRWRRLQERVGDLGESYARARLPIMSGAGAQNE
jgi:hypothetical protein